MVPLAFIYILIPHNIILLHSHHSFNPILIITFAFLGTFLQDLQITVSAYTHFCSNILVYLWLDLQSYLLYLVYSDNVRNLHSGSKPNAVKSHWAMKSLE